MWAEVAFDDDEFVNRKSFRFKIPVLMKAGEMMCAVWRAQPRNGQVRVKSLRLTREARALGLRFQTLLQMKEPARFVFDSEP